MHMLISVRTLMEKVFGPFLEALWVEIDESIFNLEKKTARMTKPVSNVSSKTLLLCLTYS